jgi:hypothetical protein
MIYTNYLSATIPKRYKHKMIVNWTKGEDEDSLGIDHPIN